VALAVLTAGVCGSSLRAQPVNPFTIHNPTQSSGPTGSLKDMGFPTFYSYRKYTPAKFALSLTDFPIEDGSVKPLGEGQFSPETMVSPPQEAAPI